MTDALSEPQVAQLFPSVKSLVLLCDAGWHFFPVDEGATGEQAKLDGFRSWGQGWRDCIRVHAETDALGLRIRVPADKHTKAEIVWEFSGTLDDVVHELLSLPEPSARQAPGLVIGTAPTLWTP